MTENWMDMPSEELAGRLIEQLTAIAPECAVSAGRNLPAPEPAVPAKDSAPAGYDGEDDESVRCPDSEDVYNYSRETEKAPISWDACALSIRRAKAAPEPIIPAVDFACKTDNDGGAERARNEEIPADDNREREELRRAAADPALRLAVLEAVLFAAAAPVDAAELAQVFAWPPEMVQSDLEALEWSLAQRGIRLQRIAGACRLVTAAEYSPWVERYLQIHNRVKLSRAQLETLAVIAYNQPITRAVIDTYRGVRSERVLNQLEDLRLIREVARAEGPGRPILYGTTQEFLRYFALDSLQELPQLFPSKAKEMKTRENCVRSAPEPPDSDGAGAEERAGNGAQAEDKPGGLGVPSESLRRLLDKMQRRQKRAAQQGGMPDESEAQDEE